VSLFLPPPLLFIGQATGENSLGTWESTIGPITEHHVEANGDPWQRRFGRSLGSANLAPPCLALCFLPVTDIWSLMAVPSVWVDWRRFARVVGPWILVLNMLWRLIRQEVLLLDWWGVMDTWHLCASTSPRGLVWVSPGPWYSVILSCAYLFHPSSEVYKWYIHFDRLVEPITMVQSKLAFGTVYDDATLPLMHLLLAISFHVYFGLSCIKS
jgi:hypothetical protein